MNNKFKKPALAVIGLIFILLSNAASSAGSDFSYGFSFLAGVSFGIIFAEIRKERKLNK